MQIKSTVLARIMLLALACAAPSLYSQSITAIAHIAGSDIINAGSLFDPMADRVKDLDPSTFSLTFINNTSPKQDVQAIMHIETYATLDEDRIRMSLYTLDSQKPFLIPKEGRTFTARDSRGLDDMQFTSMSNDANIQKLKDKIWDPASGGKVPSGKYDIVIKVTVVKVGVQAVDEQVPVNVPPVVVSNPTIAALIMPSENGYQYPTPFPQFQWTYDTRGVRLSVFEKRPDQQSLEDATQASDPFLQVQIDRQTSHGTSIFTYPQSAAALPGIDILKGPRPLELGKTYVLVLEGLREAFASEADPLRTIRSFTISDARGHASVRTDRNDADPNFQFIVDRAQNADMTIDWESITHNTVPITVEKLRELLIKHRLKKPIISIEE